MRLSLHVGLLVGDTIGLSSSGVLYILEREDIISVWILLGRVSLQSSSLVIAPLPLQVRRNLLHHLVILVVW